MPSHKLSELLNALPLPYRRTGGDPEILEVVTDSRRVRPGALFVAYRGLQHDKHAFIPDALARGASAVVGERPREEVPIPESIPYVEVPSGREALAWLCAAFWGFPSRRLLLIGVTGTDGKTTTVNLIHSILTAAGRQAGMISTVNAVIGDRVYDTGLHTTTPEAPDVQRYLAEMIEAGLTHAVLETTSEGLAQHRVTACDFDIAVLTNLTHEHLYFHGTWENYRAAKARLFEMLKTSADKGFPKTAVLNAEDPSYDYFRRIPADRYLSYALERPADLTVEDLRFEPDRTRFRLWTPAGAISVETTLVGAYNVANILAAAGVGIALGLPLEAIAEGVQRLRGIPGRMERIDEGQDFLAIVDFAHTPNALEQALKTARRMTSGQVIVVFGSAGLRDVQKRGMMGRVAGRLADRIVITAEDPRTEDLETILEAIAEGIRAEGRVEGMDFWHIPDRAEAIRFAVGLARTGDLVIACGKGHEASICYGTVEYPWDEREVMRAALRERLGKGRNLISPWCHLRRAHGSPMPFFERETP
ncbi:UDP-N-acetylmuramoyl-L-alanyl-D-glutamate--2,6-diaminopimelate ligase [Thermoflexus sp.]|uniref:UDP-N-acetylmuramoyl-L-alanyl-D-glutamate--2, 6-diaminopimelate ligase n=1 Tax=Thermoflexus sp. TaxID=1969742 RepID=UPI0035E41348